MLTINGQNPAETVGVEKVPMHVECEENIFFEPCECKIGDYHLAVVHTDTCKSGKMYS